MEQGGEGKKFDLATPESSQVITLPVAKSQARNKRNTDKKGGSVYSKWVVLLPVLALDGGWVGVRASEKSSHAPHHAAATSLTLPIGQIPPYEHAVFATRAGVARDLKISPWQAKYCFVVWPAHTTEVGAQGALLKPERLLRLPWGL